MRLRGENRDYGGAGLGGEMDDGITAPKQVVVAGQDEPEQVAVAGQDEPEQVAVARGVGSARFVFLVTRWSLASGAARQGLRGCQ